VEEAEIMNVELGDFNIKHLEVLRKGLAHIFRTTKQENVAKGIEKANYDQLIMLLHLGFSEKALLESVHGKVILQMFDYKS